METKSLRKVFIPLSVRKEKRTTNGQNAIGILPNFGLGLLQCMEKAVRSEEARLNFTIFADALTATPGGGQAAALQLSNIGKQFIQTVANGNDSVKLTKAIKGMTVTIYNYGANTLEVFALEGDKMDNVLNGSTTIAAGAKAEFLAHKNDDWLELA